MKTALLAALAIFGITLSSFAQEHTGRYRPDVYQQPGRSGGLAYEVNHLNRMTEHVRRELRRSDAGWRVRGEFTHISREVNDINYRFSRGNYHPNRLHRLIEHTHAELHHIEQLLRLQPRSYYNWR
jgi:hypothetical protein